MKFSLVCRTCLSSDSLKPIFKNKNESYNMKIYKVTGIMIHYNDELPQNMCKTCLYKVNEMHTFRKQCKDVETKLIKIIEKENQINFIRYQKKHEKTKKIIVENNNHDELSDDETIAVSDDDDGLRNEILNFNNGVAKNNALDSSNVDIKNIYEPKLELTSVMIVNKTNDDGIDIDSDDDKPLKLLFDSETKLNTAEINNGNFSNDNKNNDNTLDFNNTDVSKTIEDKKQLNIESKLKQLNKKINSNDLNCNNGLNIVEEINLETMKSTDIPGLPYDLIKDPKTDKVTKVYCKLCSKELSIRSIASHMARRHPGADRRKVKCDLCDSYVMADKLNRHKIMMHGNGCSMCRYCKLKFEVKEKLVDHVKCCTAKKRKRKNNDSGRELLQCDVCHKVMQKASLRMHKAMKHAGLKPVCQHCGRSFGNKFRLNEHYRAKHGYEKFKCKSCDFTSAGVMAMRNHERRHRGEKPFVCETCGVKFHASYLLIQHRQSHRTEKLVKCDLCPAAFKANNSLHMHKLTCHSNSTYMCTLCCRSYKCRHYALKHIRHVHRYNGNAPPVAVVTKDDVDTVTKN